MSVEVYLGNPPENIKAWIQEYSQLPGHPETRFTLQNGTVETYNITGALDEEWLVNNGYLAKDSWGEWLKNITQIDIGNTVTSISAAAFNICFTLTDVMISSSIEVISGNAFNACAALTNVTIPDSVTSIGDDAFYNCSGLTSVTITANGGNAENVKQMMINAGVPSNITWNMPS